MRNLKIFAVISLMVLSTGVMFAQSKSELKAVGTWAFSAPDAPYGYDTGDIVITVEAKKLAGEIVFSEYYKLKVQDLKVEKDVLTFKAYVEGETIHTKATLTKDELKGNVTFSEGTMPITAKRKKK